VVGIPSPTLETRIATLQLDRRLGTSTLGAVFAEYLTVKRLASPLLIIGAPYLALCLQGLQFLRSISTQYNY